MKKTFLLLLFFVSTIGITAQGLNSIITEIDYNNATRYTGGRKIARSTDGYVVVIFEPGSSWTNQDTWYAIYNSVFSSWDVAQLSNSLQNDTGTPAVFADETGKIFGVWKEQAADTKRNAMFSACTFVDEFTHSWSTPVIADDIDNNAGVLTVDADDSNNPFIMFSIWNDPAVFDANIYVSKTDDNGSNWTTDNLTSVFPSPGYVPFNYIDVNLTNGQNGKMYATWEDKPTEITNQYEIMFSEYSPGIGWSYPEIVSPIFDGGAQMQKYVDAVTPTSNAISVYEMGPEGYTFEGKSSVVYNDNGTSQVFSVLFNTYYTVPALNNKEWIGDFLTYMGINSSSNVLFVDDDNRYNNESSVSSALDSLGFSYTSFNCGNNAGMATNIPSSTDYDGKDVVIWFTGDDYANLALWNIADEDNTELMNYLNTTNKKLIIIGIDFLYDRYGTAPDTFIPGDFVYDKLGIESYDGQSWRDDGSTGVTELNLVSGNLMSDLSQISWGQGGTRQGEPSIATDPSNKLHMAFLDDNGKHILYKTYKDGVWSEAIQLDNSPDTISVMRPNISIDPNFGIYVIWQEVTENFGGVGVYNIKYITSPDGGLNWNSVTQLSNTSYLDASGNSTKNATIGKKVRNAIPPVGFLGGAEVVWTEANANSSLGFYIMYSRIPYVGTQSDLESVNQIPTKYQLSQNYPNPFNPTTEINFSIPTNENVKLVVHNTLGQEIVELVNSKLSAGNYKFSFDASLLPSGVYFYTLQSANYIQTKKMILLK